MGQERTPQRRALVVGTHLREGRKGRTGPDAATVLHVGTPGFSFAEGEIWGLHTGWSGNHTHYAERSWTGEQVVGGGELLLPGEVRLASGQAYESPWIYGSYGRGLDQVARRFHRFLRARDEHPHADRAVTLNVWEAVYFNPTSTDCCSSQNGPPLSGSSASSLTTAGSAAAVTIAPGLAIGPFPRTSGPTVCTPS